MTQVDAPNKPPAAWRLLMKLQNPFMKWLLRSPFHGVVSHVYMLITFTGRKSGKIYTTPVQYAQDDNTLHIITSEGYTWWKNLCGGAVVQVHVRGITYPAHADATTDPQVITCLLEKLYPNLDAKRRATFVPGKVGITVTLEEEK